MDTLKLDQSYRYFKTTKINGPVCRSRKSWLCWKQIRQRLADKSEAWVEASVRGKQMKPHSPEEGEEWTGGPWTLAEGINGYMDTLRALAEGRVLMPKKIHTRSDGQVAARIFPNTIFDKILLNGITAEVWMQPGVTEANLKDKMAAFYRQENPQGKGRPGAWGRQCCRHPAARCALPVVRSGSGGHPENEPGQRLPRAGL